MQIILSDNAAHFLRIHASFLGSYVWLHVLIQQDTSQSSCAQGSVSLLQVCLQACLSYHSVADEHPCFILWSKTFASSVVSEETVIVNINDAFVCQLRPVVVCVKGKTPDVYGCPFLYTIYPESNHERAVVRTVISYEFSPNDLVSILTPTSGLCQPSQHTHSLCVL